MKQGRHFQELAQEIQRIEETKVDYLADTRHTQMTLANSTNGDSLEPLSGSCTCMALSRLRVVATCSWASLVPRKLRSSITNPFYVPVRA